MSFLDWLIRTREEQLASEDDRFKTAGPFRLGSYSAALESDFRDISEMVSAVSAEMAKPDEFYGRASHDGTFNLSGDKLTYKTAFPNGTANDVIHVKIVRETRKKRAVIIIPHWNARATSYTLPGRIISYFGFSVFVMTLPHHSSRGDESNQPVANEFLNANLGAAIRSVRQSVADTGVLIGWLKERGYKEINLVGVSLGSCIGALLAAFDRRICKTALLLTAGDFAETVWTGRATAHIRKQVEDHISLESLRKIWSIISPINFAQRLADNAAPLLILTGRRDRVVSFQLGQDFVGALQSAGVQFSARVLPCGHYTLARFPFNVACLLLTLRFLGSRGDPARRLNSWLPRRRIMAVADWPRRLPRNPDRQSPA
jgi:hypothetical protein